MMKATIIVGTNNGNDSVGFEGSGSDKEIMEFIGAMESLKFKLLKISDERKMGDGTSRVSTEETGVSKEARKQLKRDKE
jgi:hypothetical protein